MMDRARPLVHELWCLDKYVTCLFLHACVSSAADCPSALSRIIGAFSHINLPTIKHRAIEEDAAEERGTHLNLGQLARRRQQAEAELEALQAAADGVSDKVCVLGGGDGFDGRGACLGYRSNR